MVRLNLTSPRAKIALAIASGLMMTSAFPKIDWHWMAWISLVPLLISLEDVSPFNGFRLGFLTGLIHQTTLNYWMVYTMNQYGNLPWAVSVPVMFLLACYLALYPALFGWVVSKTLKNVRLTILLVPFLWVTLEYFRTYVFSGFPWELLGYSQFKNIRLIQLSDITGVYGVSFLIVCVNALIFAACRHWVKSSGQAGPASKLSSLSLITSAGLLFMVVWTYGSFQVLHMDAQINTAPHSKITVVQGNIDQGVKWDPKFQKKTIEKYIALSETAKIDAPDLIVWPETAAPFYFLYEQPLTAILEKGIRDTQTEFLIGAPSFSITKDDHVDYYNSAYLIGPGGAVDAKYDKVHLVPFGEYVPFKKWLPFIGKIVEQVGDFKAGHKGAILSWKNHRLGVLICYELIFPSLSRQAVKNGASALINITNDAWYGRTSAPYQHFSMAVFRAVENRRSLVRAANTGFSGFIDPVGRILNQTELFEDAVETRAVPMLSEQSFYTRHGDLFSWSCVAVSGLLIFLALFKTRKT